MQTLRLATVFSGIGSPEFAAKLVYDEVVNIAACELDTFARSTFKANHEIDSEHFHDDINWVDFTQYRGKVDVFVGGSPCQSFSIIGKMAGEDSHNGSLIYQYARAVQEMLPPVLIYENVKNFMHIDNGDTFKNFKQMLSDAGYHIHYKVLRSSDYGVPQMRERVYVVGFLDFEEYLNFEFEAPKEYNLTMDDFMDDDDDVDPKHILSQAMINFLERPATKSFKGRYKIKSRDDKEAYTLCANTNNRRTDNFVRYTGQIPDYIEAGMDSEGLPLRRLTEDEYLRFQGFDTDIFKKVVSMTQIYKQAGNSMTVAVVEMLFRQIKKAQGGEDG
jgi:DNA (cytosine-5)-methyltransferase 1